MKTFDDLTKDYVKATQLFLKENSTYFTHMPEQVRVTLIEDERGISIGLWVDKSECNG